LLVFLIFLHHQYVIFVFVFCLFTTSPPS
jgi:hypothetical protein